MSATTSTARSKSLKQLRGEFKQSGVFYTPPALADYLRSLIPGDPESVYDPTCGRGSLLAVFGDSTAKFGQDIDPDAIADAQETLVNFTGITGDVLEAPEFPGPFPAVVANPPFSIRWNPAAAAPLPGPTVPTQSRADFAFLLHIIDRLAPGGTAAVLQFPGVLYRGGREAQLRRWMVEHGHVAEVHRIPGGSFDDTTIDTAVLVLRSDGWRPYVRFLDTETGLDAEVMAETIEDNGWTLSVPAYVQPDPEPAEPFDAWGTEQAARRGVVRRVRNEIEFSRQVAEFEGWSIAPLLDDLARTIEEYRV